jgi:uroporphyrinogen-III synthase
MAELIRRYEGSPVVAPSMREVALSENRAAIELLPAIEAGRCDGLILMTGVGTRTLNEVFLTQYDSQRIATALKKIALIARGPNPDCA